MWIKHSFTPIYLAALLSLLGAAFSAPQALAMFAPADDEKEYALALDSAIAHFEKFKVYLEDSKNKEAMKELQAIIDLGFPKNIKDDSGQLLQVEAHIYLGEMYIEQADKANDTGKKTDFLQNAVSTLKDGIGKAPDIDERTYDLYMDLGRAYKLLKKPDEAIEAYETAEKINKKLIEREKAKQSG